MGTIYVIEGRVNKKREHLTAGCSALARNNKNEQFVRVKFLEFVAGGEGGGIFLCEHKGEKKRFAECVREDE